MEILAIVADIHADRETALRTLLDRLKRTPRKLFKKFKTLHFASFVIFDAEALGRSPAKLVFDFTVDDGQAEAFVAECESNPTIQGIFGHCVDCQPLTGYLWRRKRRPQLYHIGTPYRTAASIRADRALRLRLERRLFASHRLTELLGQRPAGMLEYWNWEVLQPWVALFLGLIVVTVAPIFFVKLWRADYRRSLKAILGLLEAIVAAGGLVGARSLWLTAVPLLRDRVKAWIPWLAAGGAVAVLVKWFWLDHPWWSIGLATLFGILLAFGVYNAAGQRRNERLAEIRPADDTRAIVREWNRLLKVHGEGDEPPALWRRLWNFRWWAGSYAVVWGGLWLADLAGGRPLTVAVLSALFFAKAVWLQVLVGWPARGRWLGFSGKGAAFIAAVTLGATILFLALTTITLPRYGLAFIVLVAIFALWGVPLESPQGEPFELTRRKKAALADHEDHDVQNHMTACVVLKDSDRPIRSFLRLLVLRTFLAINNLIFFRAWLPDVCKGKLFMLPTVHAAQWLILDKRNYLFLSNYDLSWTTYLDDFGLALGQGILKIWGQGRNNPGVTDLAAFKDFARSTMVPWSLWYQAYPGLTVRQIWNNETIRRGVVSGAEEEAIARVIRRFGAAPTIPADLVAHARVN
jgi:hypothetical protein